MQLDILGTLGCHLCDEADQIVREVLEANPTISGLLVLNQVDISESDDLMARYAERIPVIYCRQSALELGWPFAHQDFVDFLNRILR